MDLSDIPAWVQTLRTLLPVPWIAGLLGSVYSLRYSEARWGARGWDLLGGTVGWGFFGPFFVAVLGLSETTRPAMYAFLGAFFVPVARRLRDQIPHVDFAEWVTRGALHGNRRRTDPTPDQER